VYKSLNENDSHVVNHILDTKFNLHLHKQNSKPNLDGC
jgi:hypothetical protein